MVNVFEIAVQRLIDLGFYNFVLPFILFVTIFYAVMRKSKFLGESEVINGLVSFIIGLFIFGMPVILGQSMTVPLSTFLTQSAVAMLVFTIGFLISSFFYPNLMEALPSIFKVPGPATWIIWVVVIFAIMFGVFSVSGNFISNAVSEAGIPSELFFLSVAIIGVFFIFLLVTMARVGD